MAPRRLGCGQCGCDGIFASRIACRECGQAAPQSVQGKALATHAKAKALFLDRWEGVNAIIMDGSADAQAEAASYEAQLKALPEATLPRDAKSGLPVFDLMLIGVGDDG